MARTVFILGAGASAASGAPLMKDFLRAIRDLSLEARETEYAEDFELVLKGYGLLQSAYAKMQMNYEGNFEELYATFEMARILQSDMFEALNPEKLSQAMKRVVGITIESKMIFSTSNSSDGGIAFQPHAYNSRFVHLLRDLARGNRPDASAAILTFNYDIGLDHALTHAQCPYSYGLDPDIDHKGIPVLKLHGSLNWVQCPSCGIVIALPLDALKRLHPLESYEPASFFVSRHLTELNHCGKSLPPEPFIVPPTWNKTEYHKTVSNVWRRAAKELSEATNIFVCGYSLPSTDQFFRHLLALSLSHGQIIDRFVVVNPDSKVAETIRTMLAEPVRSVFHHLGGTFENNFQNMRAQLNLAIDERWNGIWDVSIRP
ncbi:MAG: hypothetical protein ACT4QE_01800 [Anaerolineales bacterium]